jgi:hypothetical protein
VGPSPQTRARPLVRSPFEERSKPDRGAFAFTWIAGPGGVKRRLEKTASAVYAVRTCGQGPDASLLESGCVTRLSRGEVQDFVGSGSRVAFLSPRVATV